MLTNWQSCLQFFNSNCSRLLVHPIQICHDFFEALSYCLNDLIHDDFVFGFNELFHVHGGGRNGNGTWVVVVETQGIGASRQIIVNSRFLNFDSKFGTFFIL